MVRSAMMELNDNRNVMFNELVKFCMVSGEIDQNLYTEYDVKRGLRDSNGKGVLTGLTEISDVVSYQVVDGVKVPSEGKLYYQGYDVENIISGIGERRYAFEEATYLLLFGELPNKKQFDSFLAILSDLQELSGDFVRDVILHNPSVNIMNSLQKAILNLYSYDEHPED
ncbi:MAG TPA: citrate/2-methylcitrate synthase, partial [Lachnospiraceae bacterium]|nr:citrate/2-methylcitrate synthase [Lachnospiraceae bacterium]